MAEEWHCTERVRDNVVDVFVVMPNRLEGDSRSECGVNHVHGIICITPDGNDSDRGRGSSPMNPYYHGPTNPHDGHPHRTFGGAVAGSLSTIMRHFKSMVTKRIHCRRDTSGAPVWQRNFYERIVRNRQELDRIRAYIRQNPARWHQDRMRPGG